MRRCSKSFTAGALRAIERAEARARYRQSRAIEPADLVAAMLDEPESRAATLLGEFGLDASLLLDMLGQRAVDPHRGRRRGRPRARRAVGRAAVDPERGDLARPRLRPDPIRRHRAPGRRAPDRAGLGRSARGGRGRRREPFGAPEGGREDRGRDHPARPGHAAARARRSRRRPRRRPDPRRLGQPRPRGAAGRRGLRPVRARRPRPDPPAQGGPPPAGRGPPRLRPRAAARLARHPRRRRHAHHDRRRSMSRENPRAVLTANFKRTAEALRTLEEYGKLFDVWVAGRFEVLRYDVYTLEKLVLTAAASRRGLGEVEADGPGRRPADPGRPDLGRRRGPGRRRRRDPAPREGPPRPRVARPAPARSAS